MKKIAVLLSGLLLSSTFISTSVFAKDVDVGEAMKVMSKSYRLVMKDTDLASFKKDLASFRAAAVEAQSGKIEDAKMGDFAAGMKALIDETDVVSKLANDGKLDAAKSEAAKLRDLMKNYHHKLGV